MAKYDWGDGKGKVHSIPLSKHRKNVKTKRKARREQADIDRVLAPKGYSDLVRDGNTAADLRYGPQERALGLQAQQTPVWFGQYQANLAGIAQGVQQGYDQAIKDVGTRQQQVNTADNTAREGLAKSMGADAKITGGQIDPSLFAQDVSAQTVRNQGQADFANLLGAHQQANNTYFGGIGTAGGAAQLAAQTQIGKDQTALAGDKGLFRQQYVSEAGDREHTKSLERKAFDLDTYKATADAADDAADNRAAARKERRARRDKQGEVNKWGYTNKEWASFTPAKRQRIQRELGPSGTGREPKSEKLSAKGLDAKVKIRSGVAQLRKHDNGLGDYWKGAYDELVTENSIDPVVARAMVQGARIGKIGPKTARRLKEDYGIDASTLRFPNRKRPKPTRVKDAPKSKGPNGQTRPN